MKRMPPPFIAFSRYPMQGVEKLGFSWSDVDEMIFFFLKGGRCVTSVLRDIRKARRTNRLGPDGL